ncbi:MAG: hypothetical protein ACOX1S_05455 [Anaerostipes sp.]|jgi:hypothetical protein
MSEFNYLAEKRRYLDSIGRTGDSCNGHRGMYCNDFELNHQEEAIEMVRKWAEEHPRITNEEKFTQVFGSVESFGNGSTIGFPFDWWNEEYKEPKRSDENDE